MKENTEKKIEYLCCSRTDNIEYVSFRRFPGSTMLIHRENFFKNLEKFDRLDSWIGVSKVTEISVRAEIPRHNIFNLIWKNACKRAIFLNAGYINDTWKKKIIK